MVSPQLEPRDGESIPHVFGDGTLCLFRFKYHEWNATMSIAETMIPWTALWLYYYEIWHATGEWLGGGEHAEGNRKRKTG